MLERFATWRKHQRDRAALAALNPEEITLLANDIGVTVQDLEELVEKHHDSGQLSKMLKAVSLDEAVLQRTQPALLRDMQRVCGLCESVAECQQALDTHTAQARFPDFCPNADALAALRAEKAE